MISHIGWLRTKHNISQLTFEFVTGYVILGVSLVAQMVKNLPAMQETQVLCLGQEDTLVKGMATHSSFLAWEIPWTEEAGGLQSMESQRAGHK